MSGARTGRRQLEAIGKNLTDKDVALIRSVADSRYLTSGQIGRLHYGSDPNSLASICARNRALTRLSDLKLVGALERRIGGVRAGSSSRIWFVTPAGARLLDQVEATEAAPVKARTYEPTWSFVEHTLAVSEIRVRLVCAERDGVLSVSALQREPQCWRTYGTSHGVQYLKPDLAVVTQCEQFEDHWFVEVDRSTEPPSRIIRACLKYEAHRRDGSEQKRTGLFPGVAWVVPDEKRRTLLRARIAADDRLTRGMYAVVVLDEFIDLMRSGIGSVEADDGA